jgi:hypothetical protein
MKTPNTKKQTILVTGACGQLVAELRKHLPGLIVNYAPDHRQQIAGSWPSSILDLQARKDWGWQPHYNFASVTEDMLAHLPNSSPDYWASTFKHLTVEK